MVERGAKTDLVWIESIWKENIKLLGNFYWMKQALPRPGHFLIVIREKAFCHYHRQKLGYVIDEVAVGKDHQRQGLAEQIVKAIPHPIFLKTDNDNEKSNKFYLKLGFKKLKESKSKNGAKTFNHYVLG